MALASPPPELRLLLTRISEAEMELYYQLLRAAALAEALAAGESRSLARPPQRFRPASGSCNAASGCGRAEAVGSAFLPGQKSYPAARLEAEGKPGGRRGSGGASLAAPRTPLSLGRVHLSSWGWLCVCVKRLGGDIKVAN